ncbi:MULTISPECIES: CYTH domain-containing protein [unclassified Prochlorococcus]|uniref:CYTH domain-containing protein n=1 Tax=unclassified Prochlorococcus TaxID=2627481 RepID=UPI000533A254|nr:MULTISPECIES: CYTH domain-containing protein [unclassified Prochlorococcus]KGG16783.1 hypothetical protein EV06_0625 [Prochlorococcus sp. MIT 0602]KGG18243.1 hypothetical protein EV07_0159 [Prochlorococcus sp. MIT 0603]
MGLEIERRFIVQGNAWKELSTEVKAFHQGYFSTSFEEWIVRLRIINEKHSEITLKARATEMINHEFEYPIPIKDALYMWDLISNKIKKKRHILNFEQGKWVVDCFEGKNFPLVLAEVELNSEKEKITKPSWCSHEITGVKSFSNAALAKSPITEWSITERQRFNLQ